MSELKLKEEIEQTLPHFRGTEKYYRLSPSFAYTDGIEYLADKAGCYWLVDLVSSYQKDLKDKHFQVWEVKVNLDKQTAVITAYDGESENTNLPEIVRQELEFTDFPLESIKLYCVDGVLFLPSEY